MPYGKNHVPLSESILIRFNKKDMQRLRQVAKNKRLGIAGLVRMIVMDYLGKGSKSV